MESYVWVSSCELLGMSWPHACSYHLGFPCRHVWDYERRCLQLHVGDQCGAALWVCVLAWIGGAILGCVIFGNVPGVLHQVMHWCVRNFACSTCLDVGLLANMVGGALLAL
jgi:hypothetical protein